MAVNPILKENPNPTLADVREWSLKMGERGVYDGNSAKQRVTAINRIIVVLGPEESQEVQWVLDNLESLLRRWATKENANPNTTRTYESKARVVLRDFLAYREDPARMMTRLRPERPRTSAAPADGNLFDVTSAPRKETRPKKEPASERPDRVPEAPEASSTSRPNRRNVPLGDGRPDFWFEVPGDGLTLKDVKKIAIHLWTLSNDFDPAGGNPFALAIRREE